MNSAEATIRDPKSDGKWTSKTKSQPIESSKDDDHQLLEELERSFCMADELEQPYMLAKEQMEDVYSKIAALEAKKRLNKKQFPESDNTELKRLKRLRNARLY